MTTAQKFRTNLRYVFALIFAYFKLGVFMSFAIIPILIKLLMQTILILLTIPASWLLRPKIVKRYMEFIKM